MKVELRNHPAQARHPVTREPLFDDDGQPVPLVKTQKAIYLDGFLIGYCGLTPGEPISIIRNSREIPPSVREIILEKVANLLGGEWDDIKKVSQCATVERPSAADD